MANQARELMLHFLIRRIRKAQAHAHLAGELMRPPDEPSLPADTKDDPDRYAHAAVSLATALGALRRARRPTADRRAESPHIHIRVEHPYF